VNNEPDTVCKGATLTLPDVLFQ